MVCLYTQFWLAGRHAVKPFNAQVGPSQFNHRSILMRCFNWCTLTNTITRSHTHTQREREREVPVPNDTLNPCGLPLSPHFRDVMPLWLSGRSLLRSSPQCGLGRSADRGRITAAKGALTSTLLNAKMTNGTPYSLVDLMDTRTRQPL